MKLRLFLTCWIVFSLHFATNVVREHYPAFALVDTGTLRVDAYAGFHADIFQHTDGHYYIGNQVTASVFVALPLLLFDPLLDKLEEHRLAQLGAGEVPVGDYATERPNRKAFYRMVRERGLDLRFGAATCITTVFFMAPLAALFALLVFAVLCRRGVAQRRAAWLTILFALGTPVFYRSVSLSHNLMLTFAGFGAFCLLWPGVHQDRLPTPKRLLWAGVLAGLCLALDYAGVIMLLCLFAYLLWMHRGPAGTRGLLRPASAFVLGTVPPVAYLLFTQWTSFGNPFLPGQYWMPRQNEFVDLGARGMTLPDWDLFWANLFDLDWGLFPFAPLLLLALVPAAYKQGPRVLPGRERVFAGVFSLILLIFCSCNQYAWLQWNTGIRYLLPIVPFAFLAAADHLSRVRPAILALIGIPAVVHTWVLTMVWYLPPVRGDAQAVPESWRLFLSEGVQFPWLSVLRRTPTLDWQVVYATWTPYVLLLTAGVAIGLVWAWPRRKASA